MKTALSLKYTDMRDLARQTADRFPDTGFFLCSDERMPHITGTDLFRCCSKAAGILEKGHTQHIAILGPGSAAWIASFFSVISAGHVIVPLHDGMQVHELEECIRQADCTVLLYDGRRAGTAEAIRQEISGLQIIELHDFLDKIRAASENYLPELKPDSVAAMYFTSGTTGKPRCVMLTNRNMGSQISAVTEVLSLSEKDVGLSLLPLSHTFEMMTCIATALHCGGTLYINESIRTVKKNLLEKHPTVLVAVPLILQTLRKEILNTAKKQGELGKLMKAMSVNDKTQRFGLDLSSRLLKDVRKPLGGALRTVICGGASLDPEVIHFFKVLGIEVLQGYGITECSPVISVNRPGHVVNGSVGQCLPCCEVRIIDREICVSGDSVSPGYYNDPEATAENFRGGWFHTGDIGWLDRKGNLFFEGRIKNLIILSNGENVSPEELEEQLYQAEGILDAIVYEKDGKITAELYTDREIIPDASAAWHIVSRINHMNASFKQIADIVLRDKTFEKTITNKIKRYS